MADVRLLIIITIFYQEAPSLKSGLHRGPNTRYILYNDTIKIYKLELKPKYINNYNIYTTRIKKKNS